MKKLGIIGGAGPYASALLYKKIIEECYQIFQGDCTSIPEIFLLNYPFEKLKKGDRRNQMEVSCPQIQYCINILVKQGIEIAAIACNTLHAFLSRVDLKGLNLIHLPLCVSKEVANNRALLLGTDLTVELNLYPKCFSPSKSEQECVEGIIERIHQGKILSSDSEILSDIVVKNHQVQAFDGVVLGCTEFSVLHAEYPLACPLKVFDSIQILAKNCIKEYL